MRSLRRGVVPKFHEAWLLAIARNVCRTRSEVTRRRAVEITRSPQLLEESFAAPPRTDDLDGLSEALGGLTEQQRRAILLREWQGLSYREIADELDLSQSAVETLLFRARGSLARKLDRSRGRVLSGLNLGSLVAWGKSLLGGAAVKVAAATLVVAAGVTAATPSVRHQVAGGGSQRSAPVAIPAPASLQPPFAAGAVAQPSTSVGASPEHQAARPTGRTAEARGRAPAAAPPETHPGAVPAPVPGSVTGGGSQTLPVTVPPPPSLPVNVEVPPLPVAPPLPVEVPPLPPLPPVPPVSVPDLPSVPPAPGLPKLP
jgi:predicted DNA-binding protein (UPF0251 family)